MKLFVVVRDESGLQSVTAYPASQEQEARDAGDLWNCDGGGEVAATFLGTDLADVLRTWPGWFEEPLQEAA